MSIYRVRKDGRREWLTLSGEWTLMRAHAMRGVDPDVAERLAKHFGGYAAL